jgi:hypothetical protein
MDKKMAESLLHSLGDDDMVKLPDTTKSSRTILPSLTQIAKGYFEKHTPHLAKELQVTLRGFRAEYHIMGNFTGVALISPSGHEVYMGMTKRNKSDPSQPMRAKCLAMIRALDEFIGARTEFRPHTFILR